ncbi:MAG: serine/threonine protein kinase [Planctomycetes bacterium]|nr:serine/threonine protein kinase [Planctomycetota bacterium]
MVEDTPTSDSSLDRQDLSGQLLGDYQLLRRLGRGGMAEVYLAEQQSLRRHVAFKVLKPSLAKDESYVKRFHNEAQAAAALVQANIVQIYEVGCIDGVHFIAQEYVAGQNIRQFLSRNGPMDAWLAVNIMRQVAAALSRAGQQGIIHRDIKPENIMLAKTGEVKVADFGLARVTGEEVDLTQVGIALGTPLYMSPEQVEGKKVDPRSDLYSLGVTCYHMLAGHPPFDGDTALSVAVQHVNTAPKPLESSRPDLPPGLCAIVHRLLAKEPNERFQNSAELLQALRALNIEDVNDEWPSGLDLWDALPDQLTLADSRVVATQQLNTVMLTQAQYARKGRRFLFIAIAGVASAFLVGAALAWVKPRDPLLPKEAQEPVRIEKQKTVDEQYRHGYAYDSEQGWKAVADNFPAKPDMDNRERHKRQYFARRAEQRLAELYLNNDEFDRALVAFTKLSELEDTELEFRAFGLVGQAIVHSRFEQVEAVRKKLVTFTQLLDESTPKTRPAVERGVFQLVEYADDMLRGKLERLIRERLPR